MTTQFHGYPAALWEYEYNSGADRQHAIDLGMIVGCRHRRAGRRRSGWGDRTHLRYRWVLTATGGIVELRHLRYFVVVAEELHFGRAAARLHMAESPLRQQIRVLEDELGVRLIERTQRVVGLTDAGKAFLDSARSVLAQVDAAAERARWAERGEVGTLRVGYVPEVTADLLPLALRTFKQRNPDIEIDIQKAPTGRLFDQLRRGQLDVTFVR